MELQTLLLRLPSIHMAYRFGRKWEKVDPNTSPTAFFVHPFCHSMLFKGHTKFGISFMSIFKETARNEQLETTILEQEMNGHPSISVHCLKLLCEGLTSAPAKFSTAVNHRGNKLYRVKGKTEQKQLNYTKVSERERKCFYFMDLFVTFLIFQLWVRYRPRLFLLVVVVCPFRRYHLPPQEIPDWSFASLGTSAHSSVSHPCRAEISLE